MSDRRPLHGRRVALLETREAERLAAMLRREGAEVVSCPATAIVDVADPQPVRAWLRRFVAGRCDDVVLLTGEGVSRLHALAQRQGEEAGFVAALARCRRITRGPKPARALRALGIEPQLRAEPPTTEGVVALLSGLPLRGRHVGVQLYPGADDRLAAFLEAAGATADSVVPYEYASHAADAAVMALIDRIGRGDIDAIAFTSVSQVRRLAGVANATGDPGRLAVALRYTMIAAVGPVVAAELERCGLHATVMPQNAFLMKPLVTAIVAAFGREG